MTACAGGGPESALQLDFVSGPPTSVVDLQADSAAALLNSLAYPGAERVESSDGGTVISASYRSSDGLAMVGHYYTSLGLEVTPQGTGASVSATVSAPPDAYALTIFLLPEVDGTVISVGVTTQGTAVEG